MKNHALLILTLALTFLIPGFDPAIAQLNNPDNNSAQVADPNLLHEPDGSGGTGEDISNTAIPGLPNKTCCPTKLTQHPFNAEPATRPPIATQEDDASSSGKGTTD